jgi:hypothetical protein
MARIRTRVSNIASCNANPYTNVLVERMEMCPYLNINFLKTSGNCATCRLSVGLINRKSVLLISTEIRSFP